MVRKYYLYVLFVFVPCIAVGFGKRLSQNEVQNRLVKGGFSEAHASQAAELYSYLDFVEFSIEGNILARKNCVDNNWDKCDERSLDLDKLKSDVKKAQAFQKERFEKIRREAEEEYLQHHQQKYDTLLRCENDFCDPI